MTRRFNFDSYKIVFNDHPFQGDGHLLGLPRYSEDMLGGRVMVASRPHEISNYWLNSLTRHGGPITINGTIESPDGSMIKLQNGRLIEHSLSTNTEGLYSYTFEFEVIHPPL